MKAFPKFWLKEGVWALGMVPLQWVHMCVMGVREGVQPGGEIWASWSQLESAAWPSEVIILIPDPCLDPHLAQIRTTLLSEVEYFCQISFRHTGIHISLFPSLNPGHIFVSILGMKSSAASLPALGCGKQWCHLWCSLYPHGNPICTTPASR